PSPRVASPAPGSSKLSAAASPAAVTSVVLSSVDDDIFGLDDLAPPAAPPAAAPTVTLPRDESLDILGELGKPAAAQPSPRPPRDVSAPATSPRPPSSRAPSPPPHVLGRLVEMGFGIGQARTALLATYADGGWHVDAAAEALVGAQDHDRR